jgi:hypothetical protein
VSTFIAPREYFPVAQLNSLRLNDIVVYFFEYPDKLKTISKNNSPSPSESQKDGINWCLEIFPVCYNKIKIISVI